MKNIHILGVEDVIVECGELLLGKKNYNRGRARKLVWAI